MLKSLRVTAPLLVLAALASGCTSKDAKLDPADPMATGSTAPVGNADAPGSYLKTQALAQAWASKPGDAKIGLEYADNLGRLGQSGGQIEVLKAVSVAHPRDAAIQSKIGKILLNANRPGEAVPVLERGVQADGNDWKMLSALGTAYDQQGQYQAARASYNRALEIQPGQLSTLNNLAMSYALEGKLPDAEKTLRNAMEQPGADAQPRIRQNLALVVGLQGRFDEARKIASADLPPAQVEANLNYLQQMLAKPNPWAQLSDQNTDQAAAN